MGRGKLEARINVPSTGYACSITDDGVSSQNATVADGYYYLSSGDTYSNGFIAAFEAALNSSGSDTWTVTIDAIEDGTGRVTIGNDGATCEVTWTNTVLRDLLGFTADLSGATSYTGSYQAQALWIASYGYQGRHGGGAFLGHPVSDKHDWRNSAGYYGGVAGQTHYVHSLRFPMELDRKANKISESVTNESFQTFLEDCIYAGKEWASVGGPIRFHSDASDDNQRTTWSVPGMSEFSPIRQDGDGWDGLWSIELPLLILVPGTDAGVTATTYNRVAEDDTGRVTEDDQTRVTEAA